MLLQLDMPCFIELVTEMEEEWIRGKRGWDGKDGLEEEGGRGHCSREVE